MQRIEKAKETETGELKTQLEAVQGDIQAQLKLKDSKITEVRSVEPGKTKLTRRRIPMHQVAAKALGGQSVS